MSLKKRSTPITKKPVRKKPEFNLNNPAIADKIEFAFECGGIKFFHFSDDFRIPTGRYKWIMNYLREVDLRCDLDTMKKDVTDAIAWLDGSKKGTISITNAGIILNKILGRLNLAFEPETIKRLASVTYFDDTEDLSDFDQNKGKEKIELWEKHKSLDFFLTKPMSELLGLKNISQESLLVYIKQTQEIIRELNSLQPLPQVDTSANGTKTS